MRWIFAGVFALLLSGCITQSGGEAQFVRGFDVQPAKYCDAKKFAQAKEADWKAATIVAEEIKDNLYQSGLISMWRNKPYIIQITNRDDGSRSFRAPDFFRRTAILKAVYDGKEIASPCLQSITIGPGKVAEIHLVPLEQGGFDFHDTVIWVPFLTQLTTIGDIGLIYVR